VYAVKASAIANRSAFITYLEYVYCPI